MAIETGRGVVGHAVEVDLGERSYAIEIGRGTIDAVGSYAGLPGSNACCIVSNHTVAALYGGRLARALSQVYEQVHVVTLPDGESHKNWATLQLIFDALLEAGCDRRTTLYALGGGVVGDMTGFASACYMRGTPYVQVPTTLLAQVDSAVGGKTAINHPLGKNMIGAFHQPVRVVADIDTLATLPRRELVAGLAEVIKYGAVADDAFLSWLEVNMGPLLSLDPGALAHAVRRSCEIKAEVVAADEREGGARAILNFGHTFAHAIETGVGYGNWLHGEAVGCGMLMAADLSARLGIVDQGVCTRLRRIIEAAGLPVVAPALGTGRYLELMRGDKKSVAGALRFVVLTGRGAAEVRAAPTDVVAATLEHFIR